MKKAKKTNVSIAKFNGLTPAKMNRVAGGSINYNASKSNTGNETYDPTTGLWTGPVSVTH